MTTLATLPHDIQNKIISYIHGIRYRSGINCKGKYMTQLAKYDERYQAVDRGIHQRLPLFQELIRINDNTLKLVLYHRFYDIHWRITITPDSVVYKYTLFVEMYKEEDNIRWVLY